MTSELLPFDRAAIREEWAIKAMQAVKAGLVLTADEELDVILTAAAKHTRAPSPAPEMTVPAPTDMSGWFEIAAQVCIDVSRCDAKPNHIKPEVAKEAAQHLRYFRAHQYRPEVTDEERQADIEALNRICEHVGTPQLAATRQDREDIQRLRRALSAPVVRGGVDVERLLETLRLLLVRWDAHKLEKVHKSVFDGYMNEIRHLVCLCTTPAPTTTGGRVGGWALYEGNGRTWIVWNSG